MKKFAVSAVVAASVSMLTMAPAAAEDVLVPIHYGDLDLATPAGADTLAQRVKRACERPDMRNLTAMAAWEQCRQSVLAEATQQLARHGAETQFAAVTAD